MNNEKRNVILNRKDSSLPAFALGASENLPDEFNPLKGKAFKPSWEHPPWPCDGKYDDGRGNTTSMDPYSGLRCLDLRRDNTCATDPQVPVGFLWVSFKAYLPSRAQCDSARKGPPILSPFVKYNQVPIPTPEQLKCVTRFALRLHIFQAKDLPAANSDGLAHAKVVVHFCGRKLATHVLARTNSPTWDTTLSGPEFMEIDVPCLGWPGNGEGYEDPFEDGKPRSYKYLAREDDEEQWEANYQMLIAAPRIEVRVVEEVNGSQVTLGRCFIKPEECSHTITDPEWRELFKGNPEVDEGQILLSAQMVHEKDPQYKLPCAELAPIHDGGKEVVMRECRIAIQILGLRGMAKSLNLNNPRVYAYVQVCHSFPNHFPPFLSLSIYSLSFPLYASFLCASAFSLPFHLFVSCMLVCSLEMCFIPSCSNVIFPFCVVPCRPRIGGMEIQSQSSRESKARGRLQRTAISWKLPSCRCCYPITWTFSLTLNSLSRIQRRGGRRRLWHGAPSRCRICIRRALRKRMRMKTEMMRRMRRRKRGQRSRRGRISSSSFWRS